MPAVETLDLRPLIVGNWKMNGSLVALAEVEAIDREARHARGVDVVLCPPFPYLALWRDRVRHLSLGAQDCHRAPGGAFTGGISARMLAECGARLVILGHSERRAAGDDNAMIAAKTTVAIEAGLAPIVCVGELVRCGAAEAFRHVETQVLPILDRAPVPQLKLAYEPVWAIGSGEQPEPDHIAEVVGLIQRTVKSRWGLVPKVLYGGSVAGGSAGELMQLPALAGLLVGSASLSAAAFGFVIRAASRATCLTS